MRHLVSLPRTSVTTLLLLLSAGLSVAAQAVTNGKIVFEAVRDPGGDSSPDPLFDSDIYVIEADGTNERRLTNTNNPGADHDPEWSPDGAKIVFVSTRDGNAEIYVMYADGAEQRRLTNTTEGDFSPSWSRDGTKIVFTRTAVGGAPAIYVMNADGSDQRRLPTNQSHAYDPDWSPDGTKIAYTGKVFANGFLNPEDVYVMNADGSNQRRLTTHDAPDFGPRWSPDGTRIAFTSERDRNSVGDRKFHVYVMSADGSNQQRLTFLGKDNRDPAWSPDGTRIVFSGYPSVDNLTEIYTMNPDGSAHTRVTNASYGEYKPDWQSISIAPPSSGPEIIMEDGFPWAVALDSVTFVRDPLPVSTARNFSPDQYTRVMLFARNAELMPGEDASAITARAEDAQHNIYQLQVEYAGKVSGFDWLTQVNVKLPDDLTGVREVWVSITLRGNVSNKALLRIKPS